MVPETARAEIVSTITVEMEYGQAEAREMLQWINEFRTGMDAWAWNETDSEKVYQPGLRELKYDHQFEKIAMQRHCHSHMKDWMVQEGLIWHLVLMGLIRVKIPELDIQQPEMHLRA